MLDVQYIVRTYYVFIIIIIIIACTARCSVSGIMEIYLARAHENLPISDQLSLTDLSLRLVEQSAQNTSHCDTCIIHVFLYIDFLDI